MYGLVYNRSNSLVTFADDHTVAPSEFTYANATFGGTNRRVMFELMEYGLNGAIINSDVG